MSADILSRDFTFWILDHLLHDSIKLQMACDSPHSQFCIFLSSYTRKSCRVKTLQGPQKDLF